VLCQQVEETNSVEEIGFASAVEAGYACERPKPDVDIQEVLKALYAEAC